ncbi:MAG TPA: hypothetical protein PLF42_15420 [Anaerolineales bacterium]|nr:hypothetical protein [Anaerolineales bacterium]
MSPAFPNLFWIRRDATNNKTLGTVLLASGVILLLASLTADVIGVIAVAAVFFPEIEIVTQ